MSTMARGDFRGHHAEVSFPSSGRQGFRWAQPDPGSRGKKQHVAGTVGEPKRVPPSPCPVLGGMQWLQASSEGHSLAQC